MISKTGSRQCKLNNLVCTSQTGVDEPTGVEPSKSVPNAHSKINVHFDPWFAQYMPLKQLEFISSAVDTGIVLHSIIVGIEDAELLETSAEAWLPERCHNHRKEVQKNIHMCVYFAG